MMQFTLVTIATLLAAASSASSSSPMLGWSTDDSVFTDISSIRAGITIPIGELVASHVHVPSKGVTVMFVQNELTIEDLTKCKASLPTIKAALASAQSSIFAPSVNAPKGLPDALARVIDGNVISIPARDFLTKHIVISSSNNTVLRVPLLNVGESICEQQQQNDKLIGEIVEYLQGFGTTVNVFIVADKKDVRSSEIRTRRDALNTAADNGIAYCTSNACRNARRVGFPVQTVYFSTTILMSIIVVLFLVSILITGVFGLMVLQNNDKFPDANDEHLIISTRNE